nr:xylulose kinase-1 [Tanacetum cinerariifolium]
MAELHFNNDHNKVAYLLKPTKSMGFHQIIDFMNGLYIRDALTANPTIYAFMVRQFWGSASKVSLPDGVRGLVATIDGTAYTVTEASIRSALQLDDLNAIDTMTNEEIFAELRDIGHYQGPNMPLLVHMLNLGEPAFVQAQQQDVSQPSPSPVVAPHPSPGPMSSPPRQSSPPPIPFGLAPTSEVVSTEPILDIPSSSRPSEPVLETITSLFRDDDTGGGSCYESPPRPPPTTPTLSPTVGVTEEPLNLTSFLALFPTFLQRIATLEAKLKATKILHRDTVNEEEARKSQELDALLDLPNASLHEPSRSTTPSKPANPEQSSEHEISPINLDVVLTLSQLKARARAATIIYKRLKKKKSSSGLDFTDADIPAGELDSAGGLDFAGGLNSAGGVDSAGGFTFAYISIAAGPNDSSSTKGVHAYLCQESEFSHLFYRLDLEGCQETTSVSACLPIAAGDPIPDDSSVSAASSIPAATPIAAGVSTTAGASGSTSEASVPIIELLDSLTKDTSLPLDPETEEQDSPLRKSSRKKSIAKKRTLPSPSKPKSDALPFNEDDLEAAFKRYLRQASDDDEPAEPVSLALGSDITTWELIPTKFRHGEMHVITRANGTVKRFSTLRELMYWAGRADLLVLDGFVLDKYKTKRATGIGLGLWMDLRTLITVRKERDASIIWNYQDQ